jgi:hypothetical protein
LIGPLAVTGFPSLAWAAPTMAENLRRFAGVMLVGLVALLGILGVVFILFYSRRVKRLLRRNNRRSRMSPLHWEGRRRKASRRTRGPQP